MHSIYTIEYSERRIFHAAAGGRRTVPACAGPRSRSLERLRDSYEIASPCPKLGSADADARAVTDFVFLVQRIDDVEPGCESFQALLIECVAHTQVDLLVVGQVSAVRNGTAVRKCQVGAQA